MKEITNIPSQIAGKSLLQGGTQQKPDPKAIAKEVESVFLNEFLKIMMEQTSFGKDKTVSTFMPLITAELAESLAERGIGIGSFVAKPDTDAKAPESTENRAQSGSDPSAVHGYQKSEGSVSQPIIMRIPVEGSITSGYGHRHDPFDGKLKHHNGVDIAVPEGTPVVAAAPGTVVFSEYSKGYGNCILIKHKDGRTSLYAHNAINYVRLGDTVEDNTVIALSGSTGRATGPHVHFEVRKEGMPVNPLREIG